MSQMAGLQVIGSRPPSRMDSRCGSALSTRRPGIEGTSNVETPKTPSIFSKFRNASYEDELFGRIEAAIVDDATYQQMSGLARSNKKTYAKELLPESLPPSRSQQNAGRSVLTVDRPPSGINRAQPKRNDPKAKRTQTSRTIVNQHPAQSTHTPSYVDETLFGPPPDEASFPAPWEKESHGKPPIFIFDGTDYRSKQAGSTQNRAQNCANQGSEKGHPSSSRPASARTKYRPPTVVHRDSYVDETLFGDRPLEAEWPAPWEKKDARNKPLLFDSFNHKVSVKHRDAQALGATQKREAQAKQISSKNFQRTSTYRPKINLP